VKILVSAAQIQASVESLAAQIQEREGNRPLTVIAIMTGSIVFLADLIRKLEMPLRVGVVQTSSYRGTARGPLAINAGMMPDIAGRDVLLVRQGGAVRALADRCNHRGGPLHRGALEDGCVTCPWHASRFRLEDGSVDRGPATSPQPTYDVRVAGDRIEIRSAASRPA